MAKTDDNEPHSGLARFTSTALKIVAYPVSAAIGYATTLFTVRNEIYKNIAQTGIFKEEKERIKLGPLREAMQNTAHPRHKDVPAYLEELNESYRGKVKEIFADAGFRAKGFGQIGDYWRGLNVNQRTEAVVFGSGVTAVVLGALLTMANSKGLMEMLSKDKADDNDPAKTR